jgi:hypothetical protein
MIIGHPLMVYPIRSSLHCVAKVEALPIAEFSLAPPSPASGARAASQRHRNISVWYNHQIHTLIHNASPTHIRAGPAPRSHTPRRSLKTLPIRLSRLRPPIPPQSRPPRRTAFLETHDQLALRQYITKSRRREARRSASEPFERAR